MDDARLQAIRARIDALDEQIQQLISERAELAQEVARSKIASAGEAAVFYRPEREAQVLRRVIERNKGPLPSDEMARLFREIMSACLALEQPLRVAYLGPEGTFTQAAALKHFGHSVKALPLPAIDEVFREVEAGTADYGVVPVENSTGGAVSHTLDRLIDSSLRVSGEVTLRVQQQLMGRTASLAEVARVYSHGQSLMQCRRWLDTHLPRAERTEVSSNAEAARRAADEPGAAAIAGALAAEIYRLPILASNIEDNPSNTTRFLILGRRDAAPSGDDKTSLLVAARNQPGALHRLLSPLAEHGVSMTRIESRPARQGMWEYVFFLDLEGHAEDAPVAAALETLRSESSMCKVLGSYPKAPIA